MSREVARILTKAIASSGMSQSAVAKSARIISAAQLSRALRCMKVLSLDELEAICKAIGVDVVAVISDADAATAPPARSVGNREDDDAIARTIDEIAERNATRKK